MTLSPVYLGAAIAAMVRVAEITYRRSFGGVGVYHAGVQFAILVNDHVYFRADDYSRLLYQQHSMVALQPRAALGVESCFYQLPDAILNNPAELRYWMRIAVEASQQEHFLDDETTLAASVRHLQVRL